MAPPHRVFVVDAVVDQLSKHGTLAAVRGDDDALAAPLRHGGRYFQQFLLVFMEREFVQDDVAAFARQHVRVAGQGMDSNARGKGDGEDGFPLNDFLPQLPGPQVVNLRPFFAVVNKLLGRSQVAGADPPVKGCPLLDAGPDGFQGGVFGQADLAAFFHKDIVGGVIQKIRLINHAPRHVRFAPDDAWLHAIKGGWRRPRWLSCRPRTSRGWSFRGSGPPGPRRPRGIHAACPPGRGGGRTRS